MKTKKLLNISELPEGKNIIGIYFLIKESTIVYIGQSKNIHSRIETHTKDINKDFDTWRYFECELVDLAFFERSFIEQYKPIYNKKDNPDYEISKKDNLIDERLTIKLSTELLNKIKERAESLGLPMSGYVRMVLLRDLESQEKEK